MKRKYNYFILFLLLLRISLYGEGYPEKPINIIVPFASPSSDQVSTNVTAYTIGTFKDIVSQELGIPIEISYLAGEQGARGYKEMVKANPDGYTLGAAGTSILGIKERKASPVGIESLTPIVQLTEDPIVFYISSRLNFKNFNEFIDYIKKNPGKLRGAWGTYGGIQHVTFLAIFKRLGLDPKKAVTWVYTKDIVRAFQDMKEDFVDFVVASLSEGYGMYQLKVARPLAIVSQERTDLLSGIPTVKEETGIDFAIMHWSGIVGPKNLPPEIVKKIADSFINACHNPQVIENLKKRHLKVSCLGTEQFQNKLKILEAKVIEILNENEIVVDKHL